ncbi:CPBP family intramembrane glutamic endopeptidase [Brevibacterium yomogidense]|uniref:CPBP family intramembrane glutamic endopeptidase n=1 Tax=Brevibacterium yomogidense TaxID=946573 RepID=UPI0018E02033|nr:CPBP family intramembrane glutamic endopeptidase [Brevibacterium yomogidense]
MLELLLFCMPAVLYLLICVRRWQLPLAEALSRVGATTGTGRDYGRAALVAVPLLGAAVVVVRTVPADVLSDPAVTIATAASGLALIGAVLRAAGEEVFFRGLVGGVLMRRLGFGWGNLLQAVVFLLPHTVLLALDGSLWPLLVLQFVTGWLLGWLRWTSGSILPGVAVHAVVNIVVGLLVA